VLQDAQCVTVEIYNSNYTFLRGDDNIIFVRTNIYVCYLAGNLTKLFDERSVYIENIYSIFESADKPFAI
jgi:hypothetical protein